MNKRMLRCLALLVPLAAATIVAGCEIAVDFDRSKIPTDGGPDAPTDAPVQQDAGSDTGTETDSGQDAGSDASSDAGQDADAAG